MCVIQFARLVSGRRKTCIGEDLIQGVEAREITGLSVEFTDEANSMLKFTKFSGHAGANGAPSGVTKINGFGTVIVTFGSGGEEVVEVRKMAGNDLLSPGSSTSSA